VQFKAPKEMKGKGGLEDVLAKQSDV